MAEFCLAERHCLLLMWWKLAAWIEGALHVKLKVQEPRQSRIQPLEVKLKVQGPRQS